MDNRIIKLLQFLRPHGLASKINCSDIINDIFPFPTNFSEYELKVEAAKISKFLALIKTQYYVEFNEDDLLFIGGFESSSTKWFNNRIFIVSLLPEGLKYLSDEETKTSSTNTNNSVIATNKSVIETNASIITLSKNQATILNRQTWIFLFTAFFALVALIVSIVSLCIDNSKNLLSKQLQEQSKVIHLLQNQLVRLKVDSSNKSMEILNLKKKK